MPTSRSMTAAGESRLRSSRSCRASVARFSCRSVRTASGTWVRYRASVDDLEAQRRCEQRPVLEHVVPRHASAAQRLGAVQAGQVAAAQLDALDLHAGEGRLAQLATLEENVRQRGLVEVALGHAAVPEDDALEPRDS